MSEMVRWEDEEELKRQVKRDISRLDKQLDIVYEKDAIVSSVKEIINNMKQIKWNIWIKMLIGTEIISWAIQMCAIFLVITMVTRYLYLLQ
ncbi:hypothetical protein RO3G_04770 [Rhizopus delemar RA 99-880]|uniref:Uncharacterized protein n=1 Tax=Rhizopus delemar (strain RA 99-880 / ATCC MYA-4621 / FGSC 9543 / NRRL 43880) TaxID=246409 RepID=I1BV35_RHIO9|nr:hypothetical protein RO3G_04770 [Rhizopus delemar RA 99-880]|eukprot:EIE80065.1 hypothetical protein RO3G_04770 [Rhizopus delemar RA 99-880]